MICKRCGVCCMVDFNAYVTEKDILRWRRENRQDILDMIDREHAFWAGDHLVSDVDGRYLTRCPFLTWEGEFHACAIHETRPDVCRNYQPGSSEICAQYKG